MSEMTFKEFKAWCSERSCDGCWSFRVVTFCVDVIRIVNKQPFWRKEKVWQEINKEYKVEETIVRTINEKIEALGKGESR